MKNKKSILNVTITAIFISVIVLTTQIKFSTGIGEGYIHIGDCMVYLSACVLPFPYCFLAAMLGGAFADILAGYSIWAIPTAIIKMLNTIPFVLATDKSKIITKKVAFMPLVSGVITVVGYFIAESILYSVASATLSIVGSCIQAICNGIIFYICASALDKANFKRRINNG